MAKRKLHDSFSDMEPEPKRLKVASLINLDNHADETEESVLNNERLTEYKDLVMQAVYLDICDLLSRNGVYSDVLSGFNQNIKTSISVCISDGSYDFWYCFLWDALEEGRRFVFATIEETLLVLVQDIEQDSAENQRNHSAELSSLCSLSILNVYMAVGNAEEKERLKSLVMRLVKVFPALDNIYPFLHHLTSTILGFDGHIVKQHIPDIIKLLVDCGADANAVDPQGNTPLHGVALCNEHENIEGACSLTEILLANGAHIDTPNICGQTALDVAIPEVKVVLHQHYPLSLQCLAASAVVHHNVPYLHCVPSAVQNFIKLHTPGQAG